MSREKTLILSGLLLIGIMAVSFADSIDRATWLLEVFPVLVALPLLAATYRRFSLTGLLYCLIFVHALVLIVGGTYTYARVPFGFWMQDVLALGRNPYDKLGHFMQGLVPVLVAREILLRGAYVSGRRMAGFLSGCVALAISAFYELIEWWVALAIGQDADAFLGTQGDPWDTQSDMFFALIGALAGLALLSKLQDRQIGLLTSNH
jgi:putative membrane protein